MTWWQQQQEEQVQLTEAEQIAVAIDRAQVEHANAMDLFEKAAMRLDAAAEAAHLAQQQADQRIEALRAVRQRAAEQQTQSTERAAKVREVFGL